ncbi:glycosyltransferase family 4 protein [Paenibacillus periandrae]|uniref:glycosyltransferase family 4 protein n=1 Tax=Paenibacillus periandrae TaxID=1761741 RepID=UPI001F09D16C|nr:glycosyltransferase family 4 protein [Paenibacillus periandrae]
MHILVVTQYFWPENFKINDLVIGLLDKGHKVTILTGKPNYPSGKFEAGYSFWGKSHDKYYECDVFRVPIIPRGKGTSIYLFANFISFALLASLFAPFLCRGKYDMVFVYEPSPITVGLPAIVMKKLIKKPLFFWVQDLWPESLSATGALNSPRLLSVVGHVVKYIYKQCDLILIQSSKFRSSIEKLNVPREKIEYFPNWAESYYMPLSTSEAELPRALPEGFNIVFAGNLGAAQDLPTIIDAAHSLKVHSDINWIMIGDGRMKSWLEKQIVEQGLEQTMYVLGKHPAETMPHYFAHADALLVTLKKSSIFALTIPSKLQSYLACGRPIISALDGEGNRILEEAGAGVSCPSEDAQALATAVLQLYEMNAEAREELGRKGKHYYDQNFDRPMLVNRLEAWMEQFTHTS